MTYVTTSTNESVDVVEACQIRHTKGLGEMCTTMVGTNFAGVMFVESSKNIHHFIKKNRFTMDIFSFSFLKFKNSHKTNFARIDVCVLLCKNSSFHIYTVKKIMTAMRNSWF
jgi:hypothetical protein